MTTTLLSNPSLCHLMKTELPLNNYADQQDPFQASFCHLTTFHHICLLVWWICSVGWFVALRPSHQLCSDVVSILWDFHSHLWDVITYEMCIENNNTTASKQLRLMYGWFD